MWVPLMVLALMASGSACPDLCECQPASGGAVAVKLQCRARVPGLSEIPVNTISLSIGQAEELEVIGLLEELQAETGSLNELAEENRTSTTFHHRPWTEGAGLPFLQELSVTNCSLVWLNVSWQGLERVRTLNLSCNEFAGLPEVLVARTINFTQLTCLDLSENSLTDVSAGGAFRTVIGLVRLSLRRNAISRVEEEAFRGLDRLEFLDLSDNRLADLPDSALTPLYSLQKLDLSGNQLQVLGARWFESLDRLRELDVSRNGLARAASGTLQPLPGLSVLKLSENPLRERDVSLLLGTGRRLETVDASRTGLARVPPALTRSVRALRLAGNKLTTIRGGDLDSYPLLRILDISENRLIDIEEDALGRLEVLEQLDISGNGLAKIPGSLPSSLTLLNLHRNSITALRLDDLQGLYNLQSLTLNDNDIAEIEPGSFGQLALLVELDLSNNPIKALPANTLAGPSNLARLRMSGLTSLRRANQEQSDMTFPVPTPERLAVLDISRSPVLARQLLADDAALSACKTLAELNLSETNITELRFDLPYILPQLRLLGLGGNYWNCTEELYWLGEWIRQHQELNDRSEPGQCAIPLELAGSFLSELPLPAIPPSAATTETSARQTELGIETGPDSGTPNVSSSTAAPVDASTGFTPDQATQRSTTGERALRYYQAPTSFRNVTWQITPPKSRDPSWKIPKPSRASLYKSSNKTRSRQASSVTDMRKDLRILDNRVESGNIDSSREEEEEEEEEEELPELKKENLVLGNPESADSNTIAEEFNNHATDSGARVSEALSAGTHPGMLVLAGAALGAAAALTVVLSRRATIRRRDSYHRHENIEVHTLTPTTELW